MTDRTPETNKQRAEEVHQRLEIEAAQRKLESDKVIAEARNRLGQNGEDANFKDEE